MKVVVIGNGIVGASVAFHLADAGVEVAMADDDRRGRATWAGAGIVSAPGRSWDPGTPPFELAAGAFHNYPELVSRLGGGPGLFDVIGELHVAPPGPDLDAVGSHLAELETAGHYQAGTVHKLDKVETLALFPYLRGDLAAVHVTSTARVDGEGMRLALTRAALRRGASLLSGPAVLDTSTGGVSGILVGNQPVRADAVVVAAGAWTADLLRPLGVGVAVEPQRGQILHLYLPGTDTSRLPCVAPIGADHYLLPFGDGRVVVGATRETGSGYDPRLTAGGVASVLEKALGVAPGLAGATMQAMRVGLRPASADGRPFLGAVPGRPGLFVATGMGPSGLTLGPYCGALVADAVLGKPPAIDLTPFLPTRAVRP